MADPVNAPPIVTTVAVAAALCSVPDRLRDLYEGREDIATLKRDITADDQASIDLAALLFRSNPQIDQYRNAVVDAQSRGDDLRGSKSSGDAGTEALAKALAKAISSGDFGSVQSIVSALSPKKS